MAPEFPAMALSYNLLSHLCCWTFIDYLKVFVIINKTVSSDLIPASVFISVGSITESRIAG